MNRLIQIIWAIGLFTIPFNRGLLLWQNNSGLENQFNPYNSTTMLMSEFLILIAVGLSLLKNPSKKSNLNVSLILIGLVWISALPSQSPLNTLIASLHALTFFAILHGIHSNLLSKNLTRRLLITTLGAQALIGLAQVGVQHSIGLEFFGESNFDVSTPGVAKIKLWETVFIRASGTFPHANLLAGALVLGLFLTMKEKNRTLKYLLSSLLMLALLSTASQGAWVGWGSGILLLNGISPLFIGIGLLILFLSSLIGGLQGLSESLEERIRLIKISLIMLIKHPLGVGWHQFTSSMQAVSSVKLQPWQFQPVHNIYLLALNELGAPMILILGASLDWIKNKMIELKSSPWSIALLTSLGVIGLFDHYLISLPQGIMLLGLGLGLATGSIPKNQGNRAKNRP